jgi:transcriptional regulator with XRE-family HTH domain
LHQCNDEHIIKLEEKGGDSMETNALIKMRRLKLNMTMKELANKVGVSEGTISRWESGDIANMKRDKIAALAKALEVPPAVLMDWEEYDAERIKKNKEVKQLYDLATVSDIKNVEIALDLLRKLEDKQ